jgi:ABC-type multidrug transport system fused ATPase/permease subunit
MAQKPLTSIGKFLFLLRAIHMRPVYMLIPISIGIVASAFEGAGVGLLVPILNGFVHKSFAFITDAPIIGPLAKKLPPEILQNDRLVFGVLLGAFVTIYLLKNILKYISTMCMTYFAIRSMHHLRKTLFSKYLSFGKFFFDTTNIGHHATLLLDFTKVAMNPILHLDRQMNALFSVCVYFVVMLFISWKLTLIALPLFFVLHFAIRSLVTHIKSFSRSITAKGSELGKKSIEILSTIPLVKSYHTETDEQRQYTEISNEMAKLDFRARKFQELLLPLQEMITLLVATSIFIICLAFFGRDQIASAPALVVYFYIIINAASKFGVISNLRGAIAAATGPLDAVLEVFNDDGKFFVRGGADAFAGLKNEIECRNLSFSYLAERQVLRDVSFTVKKGEMTAIVGPTGAGKSTIIHLLMRYYDCPPGSILLDGVDVRNFTLASYLEKVALVSQETLLLHASLRDNIAYGLKRDVSDEEIRVVIEQSRLTSFIEKLPLGLETLIGDRGVRLSGGEKQRVSIARALLKGAEILILDEATSSLDSQTEKLIQEAIDEAIQGRTAIVIAHRLSTIRNADKIVVLEEGRKTEEGTLEELLELRGTFFNLWSEQKF